jgi:hypothetical protein
VYLKIRWRWRRSLPWQMTRLRCISNSWPITSTKRGQASVLGRGSTLIMSASSPSPRCTLQPPLTLLEPGTDMCTLLAPLSCYPEKLCSLAVATSDETISRIDRHSSLHSCIDSHRIVSPFQNPTGQTLGNGACPGLSILIFSFPIRSSYIAQ